MTKAVEEQLRRCRSEVDRLNARVVELKSTWSYRISAPIRLVERAIASVRKRPLKENLARTYRGFIELMLFHSDKSHAAYREWIDEFDVLTDYDVSQIHNHISSFGAAPRISVIVLPSLGSAETTWASLRAQLYRGFEVVWAAGLRSLIDTELSVRAIDQKPGMPPAELFNAALAEASNEFCLAIEAGDVLSRQALYRYAHAILENRDANLIYTDEDELTSFGERVRPFFKPAWNAQLALAMNYVGRSALFRTECLRAASGASAAAGQAWRWDLLLRVIGGETAPTKTTRIPAVLLHRRKGDDWPRPAELADGVSVVSAALARRDISASIAIDQRGWLSITPNPPSPPPPVSIIIPTRDRVALLKCCIDSLLTKTTYPNFDITIVDNQSQEKETLDYFESLKGQPRVSIVVWPKPFNFAALHNEVIPQTRGEFLVLLNNDTEVISADWLGIMVGFAVQPGVGIVGAKLYFPNDTTQHVGVAIELPDLPRHIFVARERNDPGLHGVLAVSRDVTAVTGACMILRRAVFDEIGGFDEQLSSDFNDIDLCLKARVHGYRNILAADAELYHFESATRSALRESPGYKTLEQQEHSAFRSRWLREAAADPHVIPDPADSLFRTSLRFSGRHQQPWRDGVIAAEELYYGVAIFSFFATVTSIGQAARGVADALHTTTIPFSCHNCEHPSGANSLTYPCEPDWRSNFSQCLFILNPPELLNLKTKLPLNRHRIGFWHWELPVFPAIWAPAFDVIDEVWVPSRFVARSLACATKLPVTIVPHAVVGSPVEKRVARDMLRLPQAAYMFLFAFDGRSFVSRKNPAGVIQAYLDAFPNDAADQTILVVKSHGPAETINGILRSAHADRRIIVIHQVFSSAEMAALTAAADAFVSLHRSEGFGLNIAEAMATGRLAIATNFSGNTDFMTADNSLLIPYQMRAVEPSDYLHGTGQWWAEPDHDAAVEALRTAVRNETLTKRLAERARQDINAQLAPQVVGRRLKAALGYREGQ